jgi:hypothetical protein
MDARFVVGFVLVCGTILPARALGAQSSAVQPTVAMPAASAPSGADQPISLFGCVAADDTTVEGFTLWDKRSRRYRPVTTTLHTPAGRPVALVGGLLPSTNIAAQFGSIDPTIVSMASTDGRQSGVGYPAGTGPVHVARQQITRVRPLRSSCPQP